MESEGAKEKEGGSDRPLVLVLNRSASDIEEEVQNSPEALTALQNEVDIEALSQFLRVWWIRNAEDGDLMEIGLDDVAGLRNEYLEEEVEGLNIFALCLRIVIGDAESRLIHMRQGGQSAEIIVSERTNEVAETLESLAMKIAPQSARQLGTLLHEDEPDHEASLIELDESDDLQRQLRAELARTDARQPRVILLRNFDGDSSRSMLLVPGLEAVQIVRRLLEVGRAKQEQNDIDQEADDDTEIDGDKSLDGPVHIDFVVDSSYEEVNGQEGTIELVRPCFEIDLKWRREFAGNLLAAGDARAERAWEQVIRVIASFGLTLAQDFRDHISMNLDEERDNELDDENVKPVLMRAKLHIDPDASLEQGVLRQWIGTPQPDAAHPEQREVAEEVFRKAEQVLFDHSDANWTSKFNSVSFVVLTPNFSSLQSQNADRVARAKLEGGRVLKNTKVPHAAMDAHRKWMEEEAKNPKTLFVIIADDCHFAPTKDGAHDWLLNNPALSGENVLRLLVSATPQNVLSETSRVADSNIVRWFKPASMYRSMDYYVETATWAVPSHVQPLRLAVKGENYDVDPRVTTHEGCAYRYPMHEYKAFCSVFSRRVREVLGLSKFFSDVDNGMEKLSLAVPRDVDLDFDENFDKKTGLLYWLGFENDRERMNAARQKAMGDGRKQYYRVAASGIPLFCDTAGNDNVVDCLPRRRQRVL
ncbi:GREB1-like protein, partial [Hondaea fermentalgiana]